MPVATHTGQQLRLNNFPFLIGTFFDGCAVLQHHFEMEQLQQSTSPLSSEPTRTIDRWLHRRRQVKQSVIDFDYRWQLILSLVGTAAVIGASGMLGVLMSRL